MAEIKFLRKEGGRKRDGTRINISILSTCNVQKRKRKGRLSVSSSVRSQTQYYDNLRILATLIIIFHIQLDGSHLGLLKQLWSDVGIQRLIWAGWSGGLAHIAGHLLGV